MDSDQSTPAKGTGKLLVLGLGNDVIADDAIGLLVARELRQHLVGRPGVEVVDTTEMGLSLLDFIVGHQALIVVDAVETGRQPPGTIHEVGEEDLKTLPGMSPHFLGVGEILVLGRMLGQPMPTEVRIFAIEVADAHTLSTQLTPALQQAFPAIVERLLAEVGRLAE